MDKIPRTYSLDPAVVQAIEILRQRGYALPEASKASVVEQAVRQAWEKQFPGQPFPVNGEQEKGK